MIIQYLSDEGYPASKMTIYDEANVKRHEREEHAMDFKRTKKAILGTIKKKEKIYYFLFLKVVLYWKEL